MRLKRFSGIILAVATFAATANASQLAGVAVKADGDRTTVTIRANGSFTHTEYRPTDNLLLVDLTGVSASKLDNQSRMLKDMPGVLSYRVTGYKGATPLIKDKTKQGDIAGILAVEAYHMGMARSQLYQAGPTARQAANAITVARGVLNGKPEIEQDIEVDGHANFVPSDKRGIAFTRTPQQVLQIAYLTPKTGVSSGGFFPNGVNGDLAST